MSKKSGVIKHKRTSQAHKDSKEGVISVQFNFDGKRYIKTHQLTIWEVKHMKELMAEHGEEARGQAIFNAAIGFCKIFAENVIATAALEYIKLHHTPKTAEGKPAPTVFDPPANPEPTMEEAVKELTESMQFLRETGL